ncbi:unnamed protein product [Cylicocyclus nassatus]|uniref:Uncharacterized protein n=1 Tax=Cylicocyclus nassatus TaxID=53992 RepID=A0AA36GUC8_CYLNA|nr:unnamed protein product [Cylicocyclus nassatus]
MMLDTEVRVLPFTEEEKARLNEKVRKMKFSRPPPKLPKTRVPTRISSPCSLRTSRTSGSTDGGKSEGSSLVDDSGISSCGSDKCLTPSQPSPPSSVDEFGQCSSVVTKLEPPFDITCDKYVCDGDDWVPDESAIDVKHDLDIDISAVAQEDYVKASTSFAASDNAMNEDSVKVDSKGDILRHNHTYATLSVDVPPLGPVEKIDATSPIVFSERLEASLTRKRVELIETSPLPRLPIGKFEEPKYGRVLLSRTFPISSLQHIMSSTMQNLEGYRALGRPSLCQAKGKPPPDSSLVADIEADLNKETVEVRPPTASVLKKKRKRKICKKPDEGASVPEIAGKRQQVTKAEVEEPRAVALKKECVVNGQVKSPTEPPIKMIFRKDADRKISAVRLEIPDLASTHTGSSGPPLSSPKAAASQAKPSHTSSSSTTVEVVDARGENSSGGLKIRIKLHPSAGSAEATIETAGNSHPAEAARETEAEVKKESPNPVAKTAQDSKNVVEDDEDDIIIVHENIRKPSPPVQQTRPWAQLNVMEQSYVAKLASLLKVTEVDITRRDWFEEICGKVEKTIYHLDLDISTLKGSRVNYRKRVEHVRFIRDQLRLLFAERQSRSYWDNNYKMSATSARRCQQRRAFVSDSSGFASECGTSAKANMVRQPPALNRRGKLDKIVERLRPAEIILKDPVPSSEVFFAVHSHQRLDMLSKVWHDLPKYKKPRGRRSIGRGSVMGWPRSFDPPRSFMMDVDGRAVILPLEQKYGGPSGPMFSQGPTAALAIGNDQ